MTESGLIRARLALEQRDEQLAETLAKELRALGFEIVQTSSRGVSFAGAYEQFKKVFAVELEATDDGNRSQTPYQLPVSMRDKGVSLYFPTKPMYFP